MNQIIRNFKGKTLISKYEGLIKLMANSLGFLQLVASFTDNKQLYPVFGEKKTLLLKKSQVHNIYNDSLDESLLKGDRAVTRSN